MEPDFSGWATKAGLKCSDGLTIMPDAFKHQDTMTVPLVWQHGHKDLENVLGHAVLENRDEGVYCNAYFNSTKKGQLGKAMVAHKDITMLSIFANQLIQKGSQVFHGMIREVSLVLAGANPGAKIDFVAIAHSDGTVENLDDEAVIFTGIEFEHAEGTDNASDAGASPQEIYNAMTEEQKNLVHFMVDAALSGKNIEHSETDSENTNEDETDDASTDDESADDSNTNDNNTSDDTSDDQSDEDDLSHQEGNTIVNVFDKDKNDADSTAKHHVLTHDAMVGILDQAKRPGQTLMSAVNAYALQHGVEDIETLFPDAKNITDRPEWVKRRTEWVAGVINGTRKTPFSRIKTMSADLTYEDARAKGYIKGNLKKEQFFGLQKRVTTPQTVYKKQKLDRDDIIDITDFDIVAWLKEEMRFMLEEEIARALLVGDGRAVDDEDKIKDPAGAAEGSGIRSILNDHELYVSRAYVNLGDADSNYNEAVEAILLARRYYKGSGQPTFYTTEENLTRMLLAKDGFQRRLYNSEQELATAMRVSSIVAVEVMEDHPDVFGIMVNLSDYTLGTDRGGQVAFFDDFDIDYNQYKYLIETRLSGALTKVKSALVVLRTEADSVEITPTAPTFVEGTGVVTIPTQTGVTYKNSDTDATLTAGAQAALDPGETLNVVAVTDATHHFSTEEEDEWAFTRPSA
jgi:hypothetical protein